MAAEDYGAAAAVRDAAGLGLLGWWAGQGEDDPRGHLLHVTRCFGRLAARVYTPSQLAEMKGWTKANPLRHNSKLLSKAPQNVSEGGIPRAHRARQSCCLPRGARKIPCYKPRIGLAGNLTEHSLWSRFGSVYI